MSMDQANQLAIPEGWRPCFFVTKVFIFITVEQESAKAHTDTVDSGAQSMVLAVTDSDTH